MDVLDEVEGLRLFVALGKLALMKLALAKLASAEVARSKIASVSRPFECAIAGRSSLLQMSGYPISAPRQRFEWRSFCN